MVSHWRWDDVEMDRPAAGLTRRFVSGDRITLARFDVDEGVLVPRHAHEHEQFVYVLEGGLRVRLGTDQVVDVMAGDVLHIPSNVPHEAVALERTLDLDVFAPPRRDWAAGTDVYLRSAEA